MAWSWLFKGACYGRQIINHTDLEGWVVNLYSFLGLITLCKKTRCGSSHNVMFHHFWVKNELSAKWRAHPGFFKLLLVEHLGHSPSVKRPWQTQGWEFSLCPLISSSLRSTNEHSCVLFTFSIYMWESRDTEKSSLCLLHIQSNKWKKAKWVSPNSRHEQRRAPCQGSV